MNSTFLEDDQLRPMWRFLLSVVVIFAVLSLTAEIVGTGVLIAKANPSLEQKIFWQSLVCLILLLPAFKLMLNAFDHRSLKSMGIAFFRGWVRELHWGMMLGGALICATVAPEWFCGFAHFTRPSRPVILSGLFSLALFAVAAAKEEVIFRGYPFQRLVEAVTPGGAVAVSAAFFGLAHLANPHHTAISTFNTMLVAVPFCLAYLRTRSLWMPMGMHFAWNFLQGFVLGLPVSGLNLSTGILTARVNGPVWLTGGAYGPEGSILATAAIFVGIAYLSITKRIYVTGEMQTLVSTPTKSSWPEPPLHLFSTPFDEPARKDRHP